MKTKIKFKDLTFTNGKIDGTPLTADTFNDIWNAIECIDYRQRELEEQMNSRRKESIKLLSLLIFSLTIILITIIAISYHIGTKQCTCYEIQAKEYNSEVENENK